MSEKRKQMLELLRSSAPAPKQSCPVHEEKPEVTISVLKARTGMKRLENWKNMFMSEWTTSSTIEPSKLNEEVMKTALEVMKKQKEGEMEQRRQEILRDTMLKPRYTFHNPIVEVDLSDLT